MNSIAKDLLDMSQSAFAGYGLKSGLKKEAKILDFPVAIRFRWIWVEKLPEEAADLLIHCRNPLSLDMG